MRDIRALASVLTVTNSSQYGSHRIDTEKNGVSVLPISHEKWRGSLSKQIFSSVERWSLLIVPGTVLGSTVHFLNPVDSMLSFIP